MFGFLLTVPVALLLFLLPGLALSRLFHLQFDTSTERLFYTISLSFAAIAGIGFLLGNTVGLNFLTVLVSFLLVSVNEIVRAGRRIWCSLSSRDVRRQTFLRFSSWIRSRWLLLAILIVAIAGLNWLYEIGIHSYDMGEHVYWAKTIMATSRLPDYSAIEPLDQAVKYTYGAHLILAQFFFLAGVPIEEYFWIPTLIGTLGIWLGVITFTQRITGSRLATYTVALVYAGAYQPSGFIGRGNLPDISGYLLIMSTVYSILRVRTTRSFSYALGLTAVSVIIYHQLATVILPVALGFAILFAYVRSRSDLAKTLSSIFSGRVRLLFWVTMILVAIAYAGTATYVTASAASQLETGNWKVYVPTVYQDPFVPGIALGLLGMAGLLTSLPRRPLGFMLLFGWIAALIFLANALLVEVPIPDSLRFLWRLTEPFSIFGGILASFLTEKQGTGLQSPVQILHWVRLPRTRSALSILLVIVIAVHVAGLFVPALEGTSDVWSSPPLYRPAETFYQDDKRIGLWLADNAPSNSVIANDLDVDSTATWVQVYSMKLHFVYRLDVGVKVAPAKYVQVYNFTKILYENPSDSRLSVLIHTYNLSYAVAHNDQIGIFASSPWFCPVPVVVSGSGALFTTKTC